MDKQDIGLFSLEYPNLVVESGTQQKGKWVRETRNILEDYQRFYPEKDPGTIYLVILQSSCQNAPEDDNVGEGCFRNLKFVKKMR